MSASGPARLTRAQREAHEKAIARKRIASNTDRLVVVTRKTLESKIAEAGRQRVGPRIVNTVVNEMVSAGELELERMGNAGELIWLPDTLPDALAERKIEARRLVETFRSYSSGMPGSKGVLGQCGEDMLERAFVNSPTMDLMDWGDTDSYRNVTLEQPSDGLVCIILPAVGRPIHDNVALVEVKNRREWPYPENFMPWKLVRNAYKLDVVGIYFSRRIPRTTFWYAFKRVGAVAVETFNQFAPPNTEAALATVRHKDGLGYHDLYFRDDVPAYLQRQVDNLPARILAARERMIAVRHIVENYVDRLADKAVIDPERRQVFDELDARLKLYDAGADDDDAVDESDIESDEDDELYEIERELQRDHEAEMGGDYEVDLRRGADQDRD